MKNCAALLFMGTVVWTTPASAQTNAVEKPVVAPAGADLAEASRQSQGFGQWIVQLNAVSAPAHEAVRGIQGEWARTMNDPNAHAAVARFFAEIDSVRAAIAESRRAVGGLDEPTFDALDLPDDLQTVVVKRQVLQTLDEMDAMTAGFRPLLNAMLANDAAAGDRAAASLFRSAAVLYENQRLFARAALATSEPNTSDHHAVQFEVLFFEVGARLIDTASRLVAGQTDTDLAAEIVRYADDIDQLADTATITARSAKQEAETSAVGAGGQAATFIERARRIEALSIENIGIWRRYSEGLRTGAAALRPGREMLRALIGLTQFIAPTRVALDDVALRQAEILAGVR